MNAAIIAKSAKTLALTAGGFLATANLAVAAAPAPTAPAPVMATATYAVMYTCTGGPGCAMGVGYAHNYSFSIDVRGGLKGTGAQVGYPQITEDLTGSLALGPAKHAASLTYLSTYNNLFAGYAIKLSGTVDATTGALSGTASSGLAGNPGADASFSVKGTRTSFAFVHGAHGDNDDVKKVNPPAKREDADETKAPKPGVMPSSEGKANGAEREDGQTADTRQASDRT
ncbi:MAG: hypothetical protein E6I84_06650 [Chloroflexi bacterium]|nr:MAG: hypothetical protein E6J32_01235 [Chloroflexota bacterium]TMD66245.1 MAG: hypothetical protein E6I84_06650 [Chloroflexota bacterium]